MLTATSIPLTNRIARATSGIVLALAVGALIGWAARISFLKTILPNSKQMAPSTAVCFILAAISLASLTNLKITPAISLRPPKGFRWDWMVLTTATAVVSIGVLKLVEAATGRALGVDNVLFADVPHPAQMAPATALSFVLFGSALLLERTRFLRSFQALCLIGGFSSWVALTQYFYGGTPLVPLAAMAVHTALAFILLNVGLLCIRTDFGLARLLTSQSPGGIVSRRLIPAALLAPTILGWLRIEGQRAGWFETEAGVSLLVLSNILIFVGFIWKNAALLDQMEAMRGQGEKRVQSQLERLSLLQQITRAIGERQDMQSIFQAAIQRLEDHLPMEFCCVCLYDPGANDFTVAAVGLKGEETAAVLGCGRQMRIAISENRLSKCAAGQLVYEPDLAEVQLPLARRFASAGLRALVAAPLLIESQLFGLLIIARRQPNSFTSGECEFLTQLSEHIALAAHQADLHAALKQAYDDLRTTQEAVLQQERLRALGQMASGIAHDINNAISPVALYTELLLEKEPNLSKRTRDYLQITQRAIGDVTHTIDRMKEFYRSRQPALELQLVDLNQMISHAVELTRARWNDMPQQSGIVIEVRLQLQPELRPVAGIESELREVLTNLIFNAVDAMPEGGTLTLRTFSTGKETGAENIHLEVCDSGLGMDEATRQRCLEPFFTTKGERGTGLGLAMVYGIVQRHNAQLDIQSRIGQGTTVSVVFPAAVLENTKSLASEDSKPTRRRILVVDDDPLLIKSLHDALTEDGHTVLTANGGQEGIDTFKAAKDHEDRFAVVITDLGMPYVDGRKVAAAVKAESPSTPVIMLTGWGQRVMTEGDVPPNVDCVLNKPPKVVDLRRALNRLSSGLS